MEMVALSKVALVCAVALLGCAYQATRPPPPAILGAPGGPPVTSPRVRLRDGRYLAYREEGAPREKARFRVVFFHGFSSSKESGFPVSSVGARGGAGHIHVVLGQSRVWRQRRQPEGQPEERRHGRRGARRRAAARGQVLRGWRLHGRLPGLGLPQLHSAQAGGSGSGGAGGELLVAAARRRVEERVREARRPGPEGLLGRAPRAVAVLRLDHAEVVPGVADRPGRARRLHRQGLGDPHRARQEEARERRPGGSVQSNAAGDPRVAVPGRDDPVWHVGVRSHRDQEPVPRRGRRRQHLAGVRGQDRPSGDPAARGAEAAVGAVPRAPRRRARAPVHGWSWGRDHQRAPAARGAAKFAERAAPGWMNVDKQIRIW